MSRSSFSIRTPSARQRQSARRERVRSTTSTVRSGPGTRCPRPGAPDRSSWADPTRRHVHHGLRGGSRGLEGPGRRHEIEPFTRYFLLPRRSGPPTRPGSSASPAIRSPSRARSSCGRATEGPLDPEAGWSRRDGPGRWPGWPALNGGVRASRARRSSGRFRGFRALVGRGAAGRARVLARRGRVRGHSGPQLLVARRAVRRLRDRLTLVVRCSGAPARRPSSSDGACPRASAAPSGLRRALLVTATGVALAGSSPSRRSSARPGSRASRPSTPGPSGCRRHKAIYFFGGLDEQVFTTAAGPTYPPLLPDPRRGGLPRDGWRGHADVPRPVLVPPDRRGGGRRGLPLPARPRRGRSAFAPARPGRPAPRRAAVRHHRPTSSSTCSSSSGPSFSCSGCATGTPGGSSRQTLLLAGATLTKREGLLFAAAALGVALGAVVREKAGGSGSRSWPPRRCRRRSGHPLAPSGTAARVSAGRPPPMRGSVPLDRALGLAASVGGRADATLWSVVPVVARSSPSRRRSSGVIGGSLPSSDPSWPSSSSSAAPGSTYSLRGRPDHRGGVGESHRPLHGRDRVLAALSHAVAARVCLETRRGRGSLESLDSARRRGGDRRCAPDRATRSSSRRTGPASRHTSDCIQIPPLRGENDISTSSSAAATRPRLPSACSSASRASATSTPRCAETGADGGKCSTTGSTSYAQGASSAAEAHDAGLEAQLEIQPPG